MNDDSLSNMVNQLINGTISDNERIELQQRLRKDADARATLRERMDLEAALHTWASEDALLDHSADASLPLRDVDRESGQPSRTAWFLIAAVAATLLVSVVWLTQSGESERPKLANRIPQGVINGDSVTEFGQLVQQANCKWNQVLPTNGRFSTGLIELVDGAAELRFDSGTNVVLESPCSLQIESADSAKLLAGTVFVDVTEVSNGFLLTTPEANIIDDGTEYAVSLAADSTEIHVFDGSVIWTPSNSSLDFEDRIVSGEARRFLRTEPNRPQRIPFGKRQFVRRIEAELRDAVGEQLLAYDGFENLAGRLRRGRSGFGWSKGWESAGRGYRQLAEVTDAPRDTPFGIDRAGRRLLSVTAGMDMRRQLDAPVDFESHDGLYVSLLAHRTVGSSVDESSFQVLLEPDSGSPRYTRRRSVSFGITSSGTPFVNNAGQIKETASRLPDDQTCLLVFRYRVHQQESTAALRVYVPGDRVDDSQPDVWTVGDVRSVPASGFQTLRFTAGEGGGWQVDELKIGTTWSAVVRATAPAE